MKHNGFFMNPMPVFLLATRDGYRVHLFVDEDHMDKLASDFEGARWAKIPEPI